MKIVASLMIMFVGLVIFLPATLFMAGHVVLHTALPMGLVTIVELIFAILVDIILAVITVACIVESVRWALW